MADNILFQYSIWHFIEAPRGIVGGWKNFLLFNLNYFSIGLLLKTFFSPWRRYVWEYPRGFSFGKYAEVFLSNLVSRVIGAILRIFLIFAGIFIEIFIVIAGAIVFLGWLALPLLLTIGFLSGLTLFF